jgi:hypothetical protein
MLLGLTHAEEMSSVLGADIEDQKEREEYVYIPTNSRGESLNQIRFKAASNLASGNYWKTKSFRNCLHVFLFYILCKNNLLIIQTIREDKLLKTM